MASSILNKPERIFVTGASGLSGAAIVRRLLADGHDVVALAGRSGLGRLADLQHPRLTIVLGDLTTFDGVACKVIVHAAGSSPNTGRDDRQLVIDTGVATARLMELAQSWGSHTLIFLSSLSVYGAVGGSLVSPDTPIERPGVYGAVKLLAEGLIAQAAPAIRSVAIRLPGVIGPQSGRNWLSTTFARILADQPVHLTNADWPFNNCLHAEDLAAFVARLIADPAWSGAHRVTVGCQDCLPIRAVVEYLIDRSGSRSTVIDDGDRLPRFTLSNDAAIALGYEPQPIQLVLDRFVSDNRS